ncbi:MAG: hypothetical protein V1872_07750 [bacterium]
MSKKSLMKITLHLIITLTWATTMVFLAYKEGILAKGKKNQLLFRELIPQNLKLDAWKSIYISNKWAGYLHTTMGQYTKKKYDRLYNHL